MVEAEVRPNLSEPLYMQKASHNWNPRKYILPEMLLQSKRYNSNNSNNYSTRTYPNRRRSG